MGLSGKFAVNDKVRDFEVGALFSELLDRITAVAQDSLVPVDERDRALARGCVHESRVVTHQTEVVILDLDLAQVHSTNGSVFNWHFVLFAGSVVGHG